MAKLFGRFYVEKYWIHYGMNDYPNTWTITTKRYKGKTLSYKIQGKKESECFSKSPYFSSSVLFSSITPRCQLLAVLVSPTQCSFLPVQNYCWICAFQYSCLSHLLSFQGIMLYWSQWSSLFRKHVLWDRN